MQTMLSDMLVALVAADRLSISFQMDEQSVIIMVTYKYEA